MVDRYSESWCRLRSARIKALKRGAVPVTSGLDQPGDLPTAFERDRGQVSLGTKNKILLRGH